MSWGRECSMYGGRGIRSGFLWESQKERVHQENLDVNGKREIVPDDMDWINPAQNMDQWRALVNTVRNRVDNEKFSPV